MDAPYTVLRWLYTIAHKGHSFERRLGTPGWMCWFSTPDLALNQLLEAFRLVLIVMRVGAALPLSYALLRLRGQKTDKEWKMYLVRARRALVNAWMEVCFLRAISRWGEFTYSS